ncbi:hypothetical protein D3A96_06060 [Robertkochia marina]|nr:hypothetical protein D3A96_06060 [Robertkochia marina]
MAVVALSSCSKDDTSGATLKLTAGIENPSATQAKGVSLLAKEPGTLDFTSGYIWISEVVFDGDFASGESVSKSIGRFSKIDFATGVAEPSLDDVTIPSGTYTNVYLGIELRDEDAQPSIIMEGTYTRTDNTEVPVRFEFNSGEVFEAETDQTVVVADEQVVTAKIVFDPNVWFSVVSVNMLDNANLNAEGVMVISGSRNEAIFDLVADRLDVSTDAVFY